MRLALLKGNRFNPWHLQAFNRLADTEVTAFRAESEVQERFQGRDDGSLNFEFERIFFDTDVGPPWKRVKNVIGQRYFDRNPRIVQFHDRLKDFDVIQTWELFTDWTAEALEAKTRFGRPVSVMVWDNLPFNMESTGRFRERKQHAASTADRFIVHTERSRRTLLMEGAPPERIVQLNPGVDTEQFCPGEGKREALGLADDEFVILFVGWLLPRKGVDFLILALRELLDDESLRDTRFRLAIAGSGPGQERVEGLIRRAGVEERCLFIGPFAYDRMPEVFRAADVFVLPSIATPEWQEQFGMSLIEAMACGVPVVSTYSGAIPEIAGDAGVLCQPNDFLSLYEALKELIEDAGKRKELADAGRQRALERFTLDAYAHGLDEVYGAMLS